VRRWQNTNAEAATPPRAVAAAPALRGLPMPKETELPYSKSRPELAQPTEAKIVRLIDSDAGPRSCSPRSTRLRSEAARRRQQ